MCVCTRVYLCVKQYLSKLWMHKENSNVCLGAIHSKLCFSLWVLESFWRQYMFEGISQTKERKLYSLLSIHHMIEINTLQYFKKDFMKQLYKSDVLSMS